MAKQNNTNAKLLALKQEGEQLRANTQEIDRLFQLGDALNEQGLERIEQLQSENKLYEKGQEQYQRLLKIQKENAKLTNASLRDYEDMDTSLVSIGNTLGKNSKAYQFQAEKLAQTKVIIESIGEQVGKNAKINDGDKENITKLLKAYKENNASILEAQKLRERDAISQKEYYELIKKAGEKYADIRSEIELSADATKLLAANIEAMDREVNTFAKSAKVASSNLKGIESTIDKIGGSGVEGARELGDVLKSAATGGKGLAAALGALAGVAAGMAYNFGLVGDKLGTVAGYDKKIIGLTADIDTINKKVDMGVEGFGARNFVLEEAMLGFNESVAQMGNQFQAASKTALFGNKLGSVGYGGAQLQMAGISAENIAESMKAASDATGKMPSGKVAADMSIMAQRTGQSTESIAIINETFQRLDKVSEKTALNLQEGVRAMADKAGVNLGSAMAEIADASKDALSFQIKSGSQLVKQVIAAKSLGVSFNEVAKAGQSMVLNYKDSIKAEMSLSAMLGKNVDLSEVRAKFMAGDQEGAMKALQAQGLDPSKMNMFQQEAFKNAAGGMDLNTLQKIMENTGKSGGSLQEGNAGGANAQFLAAKSSAEAGLAAANAMTSAAAELKRIALKAESDIQRQDAIIKNVGGVADKMNEVAQEQFKKTAETTITTALISLVVGAVTAYMSGKAMGLGGGGANSPTTTTSGKSKPTTTTSTTTSPSGNSGRMRGPNGRFLPKAPAIPPVKATGLLKFLPKAGPLLKVIPKLATVTKGLGVVGSVLGAGVDFASRKDEGQTNTQAAAGVGGGLAGAALGAKGGAMAGAAIGAFFGGVGAAPGAIIGGLIGGGLGYFTGSSIADSLTGAGKKPAEISTAKPVSKAEQSKAVEAGAKPTVNAVNAMAQEQIDAQKIATDNAKVILTEAEYSTKIQQEIVSLLGINAQFLSQITENTGMGNPNINLNGKVVSTTLLNLARIQYGVAKTQ